MSYREIYKSHYSRLIREGILKSFMPGLIGGFAAAIIIALVTMFTDFNGLWVAIGALFGVTAICTVVLYFVKFRPNDKTATERLDRLGFEERFVTMRELDGDDSAIARMQRADTLAVLNASVERNGGKLVKPKAVTFSEKLASVGLTLTVFIVLCVLAALAVATLVLTALPKDTISDVLNRLPKYTVSYNSDGEEGLLHDGNGNLLTDGNNFGIVQTVVQGNSSTTVVADAYCSTDRAVGEGEEEMNYAFIGWSDGWLNDEGKVDPSRHDTSVYGSIDVSAKYELIETPKDLQLGQSGESAGGEGSGGEGENGDPGAGNTSTPPQEGDGDSDENGEEGDANPDAIGGSAGSSVYDENGQIIDEETDYREYYQEYYDAAMDMISNIEDLPPELRKIIENYFSSLK